jgi:hypothetical protein
MIEADEVRDTILRYLRARRAFEIDAYRQIEGLDGEDAEVAMSELVRAFAAYRARHMVPEAEPVLTGAAEGSVNPDAIEWLSVKVTGDRATARTLEPSWNPEEPDRYEYRLERRDGRWLLTDRHWHDPSTRAYWIKGLLWPSRLMPQRHARTAEPAGPCHPGIGWPIPRWIHAAWSSVDRRDAYQRWPHDAAASRPPPAARRAGNEPTSLVRRAPTGCPARPAHPRGA